MFTEEEEDEGDNEVGAAGEHGEGEEQRRDQDPRPADNRVSSRVLNLTKQQD